MSDRILGAVCVVVAACMAWAAQDYVPAFSYEPVGPRAFPRLLAALMAIGGAWLVLKPSLVGNPLQGTPVKLIGLSAATVFVYALLFQVLGFPLATAVMAVPVGTSFGGNWKQSLVGGIGLGLGFYLLFDKLLDVVLPTGILSFIFGGR
ncbi:tripartite tricarboxylate transporter TctB family protein [Rhodoferax sp. PAMC 29310]|uniref:tripartite tricarboxylate transporter TctB family protein n=1 Tax=Rhodoferax sp. PAMC 29310 TaxID=2822760 RepID=UPI001B31F786|nr:tripartite tricarboxylate transporter TctB family protein [Rhodoferax sp. PAMC 29310]